ncbi:MAG: uL15m family ribosomal protein [Candidatus Micrarchaeia archaeon]|jgi:large subunit ribosomal protein L15
MARRIKSKSRKYLGNRTWGAGNAKNRRGKGSKGGKGRAGYHKHKWLQTIKRGEHKPDNKGFLNVVKKAVETVTLEEILLKAQENFWPKDEKDASAISVDLAKKGARVKVIGNCEFPIKANVSAGYFSKGAFEKIQASGGKAIATQQPIPKKAPKKKKA